MSASTTKKAPLGWEDIIARAAEGGYGDVLIRCAEDDLLRGPVIGISRQGPDVVIEIGWMAERTGGVWRSYPDLSRYVSMEVDPKTGIIEMHVPATTSGTKERSGCVLFEISDAGAVKLFDRGCPGYGFDPIDVDGLSDVHRKQWFAHMLDLSRGARWPQIIARAEELASKNLLPVERLQHIKQLAQQGARPH